jgi:uncharacterized protein YyaL (SSP411 family)
MRRRHSDGLVRRLVLGILVAGATSHATATSNAAPSTLPSGLTFDGKTYTNRLVRSQDPYLLLHAHNPVDWYPWGPDALAAAKRENKPIFVSIGYSTCYWCHVAERQIYSDPDIAKLMNEWFINVKVDREERPDIDRVYMLATQILGGSGGWPNNLFLTPDLKPFYAGSYFPPSDRGAQPGFPRILQDMHSAWTDDRVKVMQVADHAYQRLQRAQAGLAANRTVALAPQQWLDELVSQASRRFDEANGGFGGGGNTQFPQAPLLGALLTEQTRRADTKSLGMVTQTLTAMAEGGVMDQLGGGFHRYSTESSWSLPHFEKMLYDNAQLLGVYARAYAITKEPFYAMIARRTAEYLEREMQASGGAFYSAQDAEVDGAEGASYVWTWAQASAVLGEAQSKRFFDLYALTPMPQAPPGHKQVEGGVLRLDRAKARALAKKNQLLIALEALQPLRETLLAARQTRPQPARDDKIVTGANALAILGFSEAGEDLHDPGLTRVAVAAADWEWTHAFDAGNAVLRHQFFHGEAGEDGFLDDYALFGQACLALHRDTGDAQWLTRAGQLADAMLKRFVASDGRLLETWDSNLLVEPPSDGDQVQPAGYSSAIALLLELGSIDGHTRYADAARHALVPIAAQITTAPSDWIGVVALLSRPQLAETLERAAKDDEGAGTPGLPSSADQVRTWASLVPTRAGADLVVTIKVAPGFHINANPASQPELIATELTFPGHLDVKVDYPAPRIFKPSFAPHGIAIYEGETALRAHLAQASAKSLSAAGLLVQACNEKFCLAPATITVPIEPPREFVAPMTPLQFR